MSDSLSASVSLLTGSTLILLATIEASNIEQAANSMPVETELSEATPPSNKPIMENTEVIPRLTRTFRVVSELVLADARMADERGWISDIPKTPMPKNSQKKIDPTEPKKAIRQ